MRIFAIISGIVLLIFGRKLFWLFVAIMGFLVGMEFAGWILADKPQWVALLIAFGAGVIGALLAVFAQGIAFALAGFYAGSYLVFILAQSFGAYNPSYALCIAGGIIGALLAVLIMDWAIILLSCLVGAGVIVKALDIRQPASFIIFVILVIIGVILQARFMNRSATT